MQRKAKTVRRQETFRACSIIHGSSDENMDPLATGLIDTLTSKFKSDYIAEKVMSSKKSVVKCITENVVGNWSRQYYKSDENLMRSINVYYSHHVMGKAKYLSLRKANKKSSKEQNMSNYVPFQSLSKYIREVDIGVLIDINNLKNGWCVSPVRPICSTTSL